MKHTLRPWTATPDTQAHCDNRHFITGISNHDGRIAHVAADVVTHNVALICSAPDLLAMLVEITEFSEVMQKGQEPTPYLVKARALIAKATGSTA